MGELQSRTIVTASACGAEITVLLKQPEGAIVLTSAYSIRAEKSELIGYTAMKSTIISISKNLATYCGQGMRVNCIAPGVIEKYLENSRKLADTYEVSVERTL